MQRINFFAIFLTLYAILNALLFIQIRYRLYFMLFWNVLLAFIPFVCVYFAIRAKSKIMKIILFIIGLFFWPNAMYLVTDFIHLSYEVYFIGDKAYAREILPWIKLFDVSIGFVFGLFMSLECVRMAVNHFKLKNISKVVFENGLFLIGSIAIYIGRFIRLNSWDMVNPLNVVNVFVSSLDAFAFMFIIALTLFSYFMYWFYTTWFKIN